MKTKLICLFALILGPGLMAMEKDASVGEKRKRKDQKIVARSAARRKAPQPLLTTHLPQQVTNWDHLPACLRPNPAKPALTSLPASMPVVAASPSTAVQPELTRTAMRASLQQMQQSRYKPNASVSALPREMWAYIACFLPAPENEQKLDPYVRLVRMAQKMKALFLTNKYMAGTLNEKNLQKRFLERLRNLYQGWVDECHLTPFLSLHFQCAAALNTPGVRTYLSEELADKLEKEELTLTTVAAGGWAQDFYTKLEPLQFSTTKKIDRGTALFIMLLDKKVPLPLTNKITRGAMMHPEVAKALVRNNYVDLKESLGHFISRDNAIGLVQMYLQDGGSINWQDRRGNTLVHWLAEWPSTQNKKLIRSIVARGINPDLYRTDVVSNFHTQRTETHTISVKEIVRRLGMNDLYPEEQQPVQVCQPAAPSLPPDFLPDQMKPK